MSHDAFISYSSNDKATADATCAILEASGIRCWIAPRDITPGVEWGEAIIDAINRCRVVILIFSANANESPQIRREVERAVSKGIPIIPLRIEDIPPTRSLEYFIGTVHWLDALTPPLEAHLLRLVESVKTLLQPLRTVAPGVRSAASPGSNSPGSIRSGRRMLAVLALALLGPAAAGVGIYWSVSGNKPQPQSQPLPSPVAVAPPSAQAVAKQVVDPALVGTFSHDSVIDGYDWHFAYSIAADGTYHSVTTQDERGTYRAANGGYRTIGANGGRVRTGTYRGVGSTAIEVTSATGAAIFRPTQPAAPVDQAHPVMLGVWRATVVQGGMTWTLTIQNNPDGTFHYQGQTEDSGSCAFADQQWRATSAVTGQSKTGTYNIVDARNVEITGPDGAAIWQRQ